MPRLRAGEKRNCMMSYRASWISGSFSSPYLLFFILLVVVVYVAVDAPALPRWRLWVKCSDCTAGDKKLRVYTTANGYDRDLFFAAKADATTRERNPRLILQRWEFILYHAYSRFFCDNELRIVTAFLTEYLLLVWPCNSFNVLCSFKPLYILWYFSKNFNS